MSFSTDFSPATAASASVVAPADPTATAASASVVAPADTTATSGFQEAPAVSFPTPPSPPGSSADVPAAPALSLQNVVSPNIQQSVSETLQINSPTMSTGSAAAIVPPAPRTHSMTAEKMGLPYALSFYTQNGSIGDLMTGLNFGSAQATIMNPSSQGYQSLNQQLRQVFEMMELLQLQLSPNMALRFVRSSVYYLSFGKDDYINFYLSSNSNSGSSVGAPKYSNHEFAHILVSEMINVVRSLHDMKIRKIICQGILPLGCTPRMAFESFDFEASQHRRRGCWEKVNRMVLEFNIMLEEKIIELNEEMPDAHILFFDVYQGIKEIIAKPERYGFDDVKSACCGLGLYGASIGCLSLEMACNNTRSHVWWDLYNPTKAVNSLLADSAWSGHPFSGLSRPMNIQDLLL
ncbi:hypothetical protein CsatA_006337 [Cannabis sativa]